MTDTSLIAHCGAREMTREDLRALPEPEPMGPRHRPIPHHRLIETLTSVLDEHHLSIEREEFAAYGEQGERLFGVMDLTSSNGMNSWSRPGTGFGLGIRGSTDESLSLQVAVGQRVFVCDNLAFSGDLIALKRKSTIRFDLESELREAIDRYKAKTASLVERLDRAKTVELPEERAKALIFDEFNRKTLPFAKLPKVAGWYFHPPAEATDVSEYPQTLHALVQAFTRECRDLRPPRRFRATTRVGHLLTAL